MTKPTVKIIFFNGPPRAGKDAAARFLHNSQLGSKEKRVYKASIKMAAPLKNAVHSLFGLHGVPHGAFEHSKDKPSPMLEQYKPRDLYISMSEDYVKKHFDEFFFGKIAVTQVKEALSSVPKCTPGDIMLILVSDSGFAPEALPLIEEYGAENCLLVRLRREGCDFRNDSRSYIHLNKEGLLETDISNNGSLEDLEAILYKVAKEFVGTA